MHNSCLGISPKYLIFRNSPKPIIDLYYALNKILNSDWLNTNLTLVDVWLAGSIIIPLQYFTNADWLKSPNILNFDSVLLFLTNIPHVTNVGLTENPTFLT